MTTHDSKSLVLAYHDAFFTLQDKAAVRRLLKADGTFIGPLSSFNQADAFLDAAAVFMRLTKSAEIKKIIAEGSDACVLYDYATIVPSLPVLPQASWFRIDAGQIAFFHVHFDAAPVLKAMENGEIAKALKGA